MGYNFIIGPTDTDSISFCKQDMSNFTTEEMISLLKEINSFLPNLIEMMDDGIYDTVIVSKAKNYILQKGDKVKIKGSSFTDSKRESAIKEMIQAIINEMLGENNLASIHDIYHRYIKESQNITDINRWTTKRTITKSVMHPERTNEQKVLDALDGEDFREGDKIFVYFDVEDKLKLAKNWQHDENKDKLLKRIYNTIEIFENLLDMGRFLNYNLKKNKKALEKLLGSDND